MQRPAFAMTLGLAIFFVTAYPTQAAAFAVTYFGAANHVDPDPVMANEFFDEPSLTLVTGTLDEGVANQRRGDGTDNISSASRRNLATDSFLGGAWCPGPCVISVPGAGRVDGVAGYSLRFGPGHIGLGTYAWSHSSISTSYAQATVALADTIHLSKPAHVHVSGTVDGSEEAVGESAIAGFRYLLNLYTPHAVYEDGVFADRLAGVQIEGQSRSTSDDPVVEVPLCDYAGLPACPRTRFSFEVDLPAGDTYFFASAIAGSHAESGGAESDFTHTMTFQIDAPGGVTISSREGLVPVSSVPEPASVVLLSAGLVGLMVRRRRHD